MSYLPIDFLIVCHHVLYDKRLAEARAEIEHLKFLLFWTSNTPQDLVHLIREHAKTVGCECLECTTFLRSEAIYNPECLECKWQPVFESLASKHGLTIARGGYEDSTPEHIPHMRNCDAHLCSGLRGDWVTFVGFGRRFATKSYSDLTAYKKFYDEIWGIINSKWIGDQNPFEL